MSYPTSSFKTIYEDVIRATGRPLSVIDTLLVDDQERYAELVNDALQLFWVRPGQDFWPGTFAVEQRAVDSAERFVLKQAAGQTEIGVIDPEECFFEERPRPGSLYGVLGMVEDRGDRIVCFDDLCPTAPFVRFQLPCPRFTRAQRNAETSYARHDRIYDPDSGECFKSLQDGNIGHELTEADWWVQEAFPAMAKTYVKWAASAELLAEDDGKYKQAARAVRELEHLEESLLPPRSVRR